MSHPPKPNGSKTPRRVARGLAVWWGIICAALMMTGAVAQSAGRPAPGGALLAGPLTGAAYGSGQRALVVFLHGDLSGGGPADYLYGDARHTARHHPDVVAVALLRPGYTDKDGRVSPGDAHGRRDHYTRENNDALAQTIRNLQARTRAQQVIGVGHSGGAAQLGAVIGRYPGLIDVAILAGCPCDVPNWRIHRAGYASWPNSISPLDLAPRVDPATTVIALVGQDDTNTLPRFSRTYVRALQANGVPARLNLVPGGHRYRYLREPVRDLLDTLLSAAEGKTNR